MSARSIVDPVEPNTAAFPLGSRTTAPLTPESLLFSSPIHIIDNHMPQFYSPDPALGLHLHDHHPIDYSVHPSVPMPARGEGRSSSTLGGSTLAGTPTDELDLQYEYFSSHTHSGCGRLSGESIGDDFKGFFNDLHLDGLYPPTTSTADISPATMTPTSDSVSPPSSHAYSSSAPAQSFLSTHGHSSGLATPFLYAGSDSPFQGAHQLGSGWDSVNPFAADVEYDSATASGPHPGSFALVKSNEDARTPQVRPPSPVTCSPPWTGPSVRPVTV